MAERPRVLPAEHGGVTVNAYERATVGNVISAHPGTVGGSGGGGTSLPLQSQVQPSWPYTYGPNKTDVAMSIVKFFIDAELLERDPDVNKFIDLVKQIASLL